MGINDFREIWLVDFEFSAPTGGIPEIRCLVAREFKSGRKIRLWVDEINQLTQPPYSINGTSLFVAYYSSAEFSCHLALGWDLPTHVLDLFVEFRNLTNGLPVSCGNGLLGALIHFNLETISSVEKDDMRNLALRGGY